MMSSIEQAIFEHNSDPTVAAFTDSWRQDRLVLLKASKKLPTSTINVSDEMALKCCLFERWNETRPVNGHSFEDFKEYLDFEWSIAHQYKVAMKAAHLADDTIDETREADDEHANATTSTTSDEELPYKSTDFMEFASKDRFANPLKLYRAAEVDRSQDEFAHAMDVAHCAFHQYEDALAQVQRTRQESRRTQAIFGMNYDREAYQAALVEEGRETQSVWKTLVDKVKSAFNHGTM